MLSYHWTLKSSCLLGVLGEQKGNRTTEKTVMLTSSGSFMVTETEEPETD